ncbi:MAG: phosphomethylpyrimidine synthase ThiC, partial [Spirochaetia bacterium]|nr:phosphomethylpyrimidine synthase ThiC [Spirochaetia bacterium]
MSAKQDMGNLGPGRDPGARRTFVAGSIHADVQVPFREISLSPTRRADGQLIPNDPVLAYDTTGPWGDPSYTGAIESGLPAIRKQWIETRGDSVEV